MKEQRRSLGYYKDEVRCGYYVPTAIKQAWAAALDVLGEVDRICTRHHIRYYADWGTLLGTVRHAGFVPWDDDLDICMLRDDYERFRAVADAELPEGYVLHDYVRQEDHWLFITRVVNASHITYTPEHLARYRNFPYMASIDIFLLDYLYEDPEKEKARGEEVLRLLTVANGIVSGTMRRPVWEREVCGFEKKYGVSLLADGGRSEMTAALRQEDGAGAHAAPGAERMLGIALYHLAERQMARVPASQAREVGQIFPWILKGGKGFDLRCYETAVRLPYEDTTMPVPAQYGEMLARRYGDYFVPRKVWTGHDYPYFEGQREALRTVAGGELPEYRFTEEMLERLPAETDGSLKALAGACVEELRRMQGEIEAGLAADLVMPEDAQQPGAAPEADHAAELAALEDAQQLAADLAALTEQTLGEAHPAAAAVTESLQAYCDAIYALYLLFSSQADTAPVCAASPEAQTGTESDGEGQDSAPVEATLMDMADEELQGAAYDSAPREALARLARCLDDVARTVEARILRRREALFLSMGAREWPGFAQAYAREAEREDTDVVVLRLPIYEKDPYGRLVGEPYEEAPEDGTGVGAEPDMDYRDYAMELRHPEVVYTQQPYDDGNPCYSIPPQYYVRSMQRYADRIVYLPPYRPDDFGPEDRNDVYCMKHYVTAPGVIGADQVLVQSENARARYIEALTAFGGEDTREHWEKKVSVASESSGAEGRRDPVGDVEAGDAPAIEVAQPRRRRILYCIGLNEMTEQGERFWPAVQERLDVFDGSADAVETRVYLYPEDARAWEGVDADSYRALCGMVERMQDASLGEGQERLPSCTQREAHYARIAGSCDAYYGSPSPLVLAFRAAGRPVMLADYTIALR